MKNRKAFYFHRILCLLLLFTLSFLTVSCAADEYSYNPNPQTDKPQGSFINSASFYGSTLYDFLDFSSVAIVGTVVDVGDTIIDNFTFEGSLPVEISMPLTPFTVKVEKVLYGDPVYSDEKNKTITYIQNGYADDDTIQIKVHKNERVVLLAEYKEEAKWYVCGELSTFLLTDKGLYSFSNLPEMAKYDGTPLELLERDIKKLVKEHKMTPENNFTARAKRALEEEKSKNPGN